MGTNTEVVGGETSPETGEAFFGGRLLEAINDVFVGEDTLSVGSLLLHLGLDVVEW